MFTSASSDAFVFFLPIQKEFLFAFMRCLASGSFKEVSSSFGADSLNFTGLRCEIEVSIIISLPAVLPIFRGHISISKCDGKIYCTVYLYTAHSSD